MEVIFFLVVFSVIFILGAYVLGSGVTGWILSPMEKDGDEL